MGKAMSFEASRRNMITAIKKQSKKTETKVIRFENNDVPEFLAELNEFERASRESTIMVG